MRILAVDYGDVRTGLAVSDPTGLIPGRTEVVRETDPTRTAAAVCRAAAACGAARIVVGCPLNMNGTKGERARKAEEFAELVRQKSGLEVVLWDERRTSVDANRILSDAGKKRGKQKALVDAVAASLILQGYLDYLRMRG